MDLQDLIPDPNKASEGVWIPYGDGAEFLIASNESTRYRKALQKASRKHPPQKLRANLDLGIEMTVEAMSQAVLLDFRGIVREGKPLENTLENRRAILSIPTLRDWIADQAADVANFHAEGEQADSADLTKSP